MNYKNRVLKMSIFTVSILTILLCISYAFLNQTITGTKNQVINSGNLRLSLNEGNELTLSNALPMYDEVGMIQEPFTFKVVNDGKVPIHYIVKLVDVTPENTERLDTNVVKYGLTKDDVDTIDLLSNLKSNQIDSGMILDNQTIEYSLRLWIDFHVEDEALISGKSLSYRIDVEAGQVEGTERKVVLNPDGGVLDETAKTVVVGEKYGKLPIPTKAGYNFLGWFNEKDEYVDKNSILDSFTEKLIAKWGVNQYTVAFNPNGGSVSPNNKQINFHEEYGELPIPIRTDATFLGWFTTLSGGEKIESTSIMNIADNHTLYAHWEILVKDKLFSSTALSSNCKTYNDGVDTFLVGQCSKNYVWYSGKLWRVVLRNNNTGAVKMITDNAMTTMPYNASNQSNFNGSYADQWLTQEFLPTLHDYEDYLVTDSVWNASLDNSSIPSRPTGTTIVSRAVGILNAYEHYTTYGHSDGLASSSTTYLNDGVWWRLITPYSSSNIWCANDSLANDNLTLGSSIRPSINLKSDIEVVSGTGTTSDSYKLAGDAQETIHGTTLLNTRYSGEYVRFNQELYRIVGVENTLTKIIAVNAPSRLASNLFSGTSINFANAGIKTELESYYQGLNSGVKAMIEPSTVWYLGIIEAGTNYKAGICKVVNNNISMNSCSKTEESTVANIGLPRGGEMFTSQITKGSKQHFWTLTRSSSRILHVNSGGNWSFGPPNQSNGTRPSMYLKSNVVISSTNTGDGTYEHPYDIELLH